MKLRSYAKINLTLDILGKRPDGYHELETVFQHIDLYDEIELTELDENKIAIECNVSGLSNETNLVYKAAKLLKDIYKIKKGVLIKLNKKIPIGAGLSGGSSNGAAVLKGLNVLWNLKLSQQELINLSKEIGMDVSFHIVGGTSLGKGRGEVLEKLPDFPKHHVIVIYPGFSISTKDAYGSLKYDKTGKIKSSRKFLKTYDLNYLHNDFEYSILEKYPLIGEVKKELGKHSLLSGSGSCIFGLYKDKEEAEAIYEKLHSKFSTIFLTTTLNKKVELAKEIGFCFGVKRALDEINKLESKEKVHILGNLIHNPQVISELESKGIKTIKDIGEAHEGIVVISAHGASDKITHEIKAKGLTLIDLTCPFVEKVHEITKDAETRGRDVIMYGDKEHTEVKGIIGNLKKYKVIKNIHELINKDLDCKITLVSQTTRDVDEFEQLVKELSLRVEDIEIKDTICFATKDRQKSAIELAKASDIMIVIGGKNSSNTLRLEEVCSKYGETRHIETEKELKPEWFFDKERIGVTAGASTPENIIEEVKKTITMIL